MLTDAEAAEQRAKAQANSNRAKRTDKPIALSRHPGGSQLHRTSHDDRNHRECSEDADDRHKRGQSVIGVPG